uniref:hypothetical protein n=1 Tax=Rhodococcus opacus TaxID=37919 RepID=UPI003F657ED4
MIILGIILAIIGAVAGIPVLLYVGIALIVIGVVLEIMGMTGHAVAGRLHYYADPVRSRTGRCASAFRDGARPETWRTP